MKKMVWWVYKCNSRNLPHQHTYGDWRDFFSIGKEQNWGSTDWVPALKNLAVGNHIVAYQTNRNEFVGLATVTQTAEKDTYVYLKPLERIGVKVRPLKKANPKIASIPALQPGPIKTIYEISDSDARRLLKAAGARYAIPLDRGNETKQKRVSLRTFGGGFGEVGNNVEGEKAAINFFCRGRSCTTP